VAAIRRAAERARERGEVVRRRAGERRRLEGEELARRAADVAERDAGGGLGRADARERRVPAEQRDGERVRRVERRRRAPRGEQRGERPVARALRLHGDLPIARAAVGTHPDIAAAPVRIGAAHRDPELGADVEARLPGASKITGGVNGSRARHTCSALPSDEPPAIEPVPATSPRRRDSPRRHGDRAVLVLARLDDAHRRCTRPELRVGDVAPVHRLEQQVAPAEAELVLIEHAVPRCRSRCAVARASCPRGSSGTRAAGRGARRRARSARRPSPPGRTCCSSSRARARGRR
jgi:hypothetical protein